MEKFCAMLGFSKEMTERFVGRKETYRYSGKIYSEQHRRNFDVKDDVCNSFEQMHLLHFEVWL